MGLWKLLGGEVNHKAIEKQQRWQEKCQVLKIKNICTAIMLEGMPKALEFENEEQIKFVLKKFPECPKITNDWGHIAWGNKDWQISNWKNAQKWLSEQEEPKLNQTQKELNEMKEKMQELEAKLVDYENKKY